MNIAVENIQIGNARYDVYASMLEDGHIMSDDEYVWAEEYPEWQIKSFFANQGAECTLSGWILQEALARVNAKWYQVERSLTRTLDPA